MPIVSKKPELNPQNIKRPQSTNRGKLHTKKNHNGIVWFESLREEGTLSQLIHDPTCIRIESQAISIPNINKGKNPYVSDIYAEFKDGIKYIYDVKDNKYFDKLRTNYLKK